MKTDRIFFDQFIGLFEGEGCLQIIERSNGSFVPRASLAQRLDRFYSLKPLVEVFGGSIQKRIGHSKNGSVLWWTHDQELCKIISEGLLKSVFQIKVREAEVMLKFLEKKTKWRYNEEDKKFFRQCVKEIKRFKKFHIGTTSTTQH